MYDGTTVPANGTSVITSNRGKELHPRNYASGIEGLSQHNSGENELAQSSFHRITKSNNFHGSFF